MNECANIIITHKCNLFCKHCYMNANNEHHENGKTIFKTYKFVVNKLKNMGIQSIMLTGGECSTSSNLEQMIEYAISLGFRISMFTNAFFLNRNTIKHIDEYFISIDGNSDYHNYIRGNNCAYDKSIENVKFLTKLGKRVTIQITVTKENIHDLQVLCNKLYEIGIKNVNIVCLLNEGRSIKNGIEQTKDYDRLKEIISDIYHATGYNMKIHTNLFDKFSTTNYLFTKMIKFPLWIDLVDENVYLIKNIKKFSIDITDLSTKKCEELNNMVYNIIFDNKKRFIKDKDYILESQIISISEN